jgi:superfamily II DNA or RNA helicase
MGNRKPNGYWTFDRCKEEALKYKTKKEWAKNSTGGYNATRKKGWVDECCYHMINSRKPNGYWTLKICKEEASKYKTKTEWQRNSASSYGAAHKKGWVNECFSNMAEIKKPNGYWTLDRCKEESSKYKTKTEWKKNSVGSYNATYKNSWINECCSHMKELNKPNSYWTFDRCKEYALKYKTRTEWAKNSAGSYNATQRNKWVYEFCFHMINSRKPRNYWTLDRCKEEVLKYKTRTEWRKNSSNSYDAARKNGWINECYPSIVESHKPKGYWTLDRCKEDALNYKTKQEWKNNSAGSYNAVCKNGWVDECCCHMINARKPNGYWTLKICKEEASKYKTKAEWRKNSADSCNAAHKNGWINECCTHMTEIKKPNGYWTLDRCKEDALSYKTKTEWEKNSPNGYSATQRNGWFNKCCSHMDILWFKKWDIDSCKKEASKYKTKAEWRKNSVSYSAAQRNNWINECCSHMTETKRQNGYWTLDRCKEEALKYKTKTEFQKNSATSFGTIHRNGWINECCSHMEEFHKPKGYWILKTCKEEALKYKTKTEWKKNSATSYTTARKNGWINECCQHMEISYFRKEVKLQLINELQYSDLLNMDSIELSIIIGQGNLPIDFGILVNTDSNSDERIATLQDLRERFLNDDNEISVETNNTITNDENEEFVEIDDVDYEITSDIIENKLRLPSVNIISELHSLDNSLYATMDEEAFESLIQYKLHKLWNQILNEEISFETIQKEDGGNYFNIIKKTFIDEYNKVIAYKPSAGYSFKHQPNLMQKLTVYRLATNRFYGNWSGTGAGKTLSFILSSREVDAKVTLVFALNSTIKQTIASIKEVYPNSVVFTEYKTNFIFDRNKHNYLVLNYEKFQQDYSEKLWQSLTNKNKIDFIVVDEVHNVKQRQEENESIRHAVINRLLGRIREKNPNVYTLVMSATPVINNLYEAKSLLKMMSGFEYDDIQTRRTLPNALNIFQQLIISGLRFLPKYEININELTGHNMSNLNIDGSHLLDRLIALPLSNLVTVEKLLLNDKLKAVKSYLKKGTIIYTYFTTDIVNEIEKYIKSLGFKCGTYTGDETPFIRDENLEKFKKGELDILIGSKPIGTGVDGLQEVCNRMILITLPWTYSEYIQLKGRIYRQGSIFYNLEFIIPQVKIELEDGEFWSWDIQRLNLIKNKKTLADAAVDGIIPSKILPTAKTMYKKAIESLDKWKERINSGNIITNSRNKLQIDLCPEITDEYKKRERIESYINDFHQRMNTSLSSTIHKDFIDNPDSWFLYHSTRKARMENWDEIPYEYIAIKIKDTRDIIADFGCGENLLRHCIPNNKVYAFDHVAIDETVTACDMKNTGLGNESIDIAVFSLALWGVNNKDYIIEANRVLKRRGLIYISEPSSKFDTLEKQSKLTDMLNNNGFQVLGNVENRGKFIYITGIKI